MPSLFVDDGTTVKEMKALAVERGMSIIQHFNEREVVIVKDATFYKANRSGSVVIDEDEAVRLLGH